MTPYVPARHGLHEGEAVADGKPVPECKSAAPTVVLHCGVGRWPGAPRAADLAALAIAGGDAVLETPAQRWVAAAVPTAPPHGGFVAAAERFDSRSFSASPAEAVPSWKATRSCGTVLKMSLPESCLNSTVPSAAFSLRRHAITERSTSSSE